LAEYQFNNTLPQVKKLYLFGALYYSSGFGFSILKMFWSNCVFLARWLGWFEQITAAVRVQPC